MFHLLLVGFPIKKKKKTATTTIKIVYQDRLSHDDAIAAKTGAS